MNQGWRGSVTGQEFVGALLDHFRERFNGLKGSRNSAKPNPDLPLSGQDAWTLEYMDATKVQAIIEAFDDDAVASPSRYITVAKVNTFTGSARPYNWRYVHMALFRQCSLSNTDCRRCIIKNH